MSDFIARLVIAFLQLAAALPRGVRAALAQLGGSFLWLTGSRSRKTTETNLQLCFPQMPRVSRRALARQSLIETVRLALEMGPSWLWSADDALALIDHVEGREHMDAAKTAGRGIVILAPHIGNWELLGLWLGRHYQAINLYQPPKSPLLDKLIHHARSRSGAVLVPTDKKGVAALLKALKNGGVTGILPDQEPEASGGAFAPFFGVPALTATLAANLARKTNAVVLAAYVKRTDNGYTLVIDPVDDAVVDVDEVIAATAVNRAVENCVNAAPAQYQWEYKRFKARNDGGEKRYRD